MADLALGFVVFAIGVVVGTANHSLFGGIWEFLKKICGKQS